MADRTTKVTLTANIAQYVQGMELAAAKTRTLGTAAEKLAAQKQAFADVGRVIFAVGALAAAGVALAIKEFADFDAKMSQVKTLSGATADEMDKLSTAALHLGQSIGFTATEVADAEIELVKAGVSVQDQLGGALLGALQLAAAGQIDVADATEIATIAMTQFALKGKDVPHVADLLAAGADKALGSVGDLGEALKSGGLVSAQFGVSLDETVGTLSAFANAGLIGETAGTDLRQMLLKLANPATDAQDAMDKLGISIYDSTGAFVGVSGLAGQLKDKLSGLAPEARNAALATIFGSRAIAGANVLYKEGAEGIEKWTNEVNDSGFAAKQAAGKMDNLNGDVTKLQAAFQTAIIETGSGANEVLRDLVQALTGIASAVGDLPQPVLTTGLALTALVALVGLTGGTALLAIPKIAAFKDGLQFLGITARGTALAVGGVTAALGVGFALFGAWANKVAEDKAAADAFRDSLDQTTGALTTYSRSLVVTSIQSAGLFEIAKKAGISQKELTDAILEGGNAYDSLREKLVDYQAAGAGNAKATQADGAASLTLASNLDRVRGSVVTGTEEFKNQKAAMEGSTDSSDDAAAAYRQAAEAASTLESNLTELVDTINKANGVGQDAITTNAAYQQTIADISDFVDKAKKKVDGYSLTVDENTAAGSKNVAMLADLAKKNEDAAKAQYDLDGSTDGYIATLTAGHQAVVDNAIALGATADQAQAIADRVAAIPDQKAVQVLLDTAAAQQQLDRFHVALGNGVVIPIHFSDSLHGGFASGGYTGDGDRTSVAGAVHGKEFVLDANATAKASNRAAAEYMLRGGDIKNYGRYSGAPAGNTGGGNVTYQFTVQAGMIADPAGLPKIITRGIQDAVKNGDIPKGWNN